MDCVSCGVTLIDNTVPYFCDPCWSSISVLPDPRCPRCDIPFSSSQALTYSPTHVCGHCRKHPPAFTKAWTPYAYHGVLKDAISQFKYHGKVRLAHPLAELMASGWHLPPNVDALMAVPLHPTRLREREYNQSLLLAYHLSRHLRIPILWNVLVRTRSTVPQTTLNRATRLRNLRRSFAVTQPEAIAGKSIVIVDDVFTTGTTSNECAKALRKAGADHVFVASLARMV